jgi:hypothetical protein
MPRLVDGNTERCCGKLKKGNSFLKSNFELEPNRSRHDSADELLIRHPQVFRYPFRGPELYTKLPKNSHADILRDLMAKGTVPRGEKLQLYPTHLAHPTLGMGWKRYQLTF